MAKKTWANVDGTWRNVKVAWLKVAGVWKKITPKGNIAGVWKEFIQYFLQLYSYGVEAQPFSIGRKTGGSSTTMIKQADHIYLYAVAGDLAGEISCVTDLPINVTDYKTMYIELTSTGVGSYADYAFGLATERTSGRTSMTVSIRSQTAFQGIDSIDITSLSGDFYPRVHAYTSTSTRSPKVYVYRIWFE